MFSYLQIGAVLALVCDDVHPLDKHILKTPGAWCREQARGEKSVWVLLANELMSVYLHRSLFVQIQAFAWCVKLIIMLKKLIIECSVPSCQACERGISFDPFTCCSSDFVIVLQFFLSSSKIFIPLFKGEDIV